MTTSKRDSPRAVARRRQMLERQWKILFQEAEVLPLNQVLKLNPGIKKSTFYERMKKAKQQKQATNNAAITPTFIKKNVHKQIFTEEQELLLAQNVKQILEAKYRIVEKEAIRGMAIDYYKQLHPHECNTRKTGPNFTASDGWIQRFKARHEICSRKPRMVKKVKASQADDVFNDQVTLALQIEEAVRKYGADYVLNMDESPCWTCEIPQHGWATKESGKCEVLTWGNPKERISLMPCITASGKKLRFSWIKKAKTYKAIREMKLPGDCASYFSNKGWVNEGIMCYWLNEVVKPYLQRKPAAIILDEYYAHWTLNVVNLCEELNIEMIQVPGGTTAVCQPLDISVMGPMKQLRQRLANEHRWNNISVLDNAEEAVIRAYQAYQLIDAETIKRGWKTVSPQLQQIIPDY